MTRRGRIACLMALALAAASMAGCGGTKKSAGAGGRTSVDTADFSFTPRELTVRPGQTVTWTNRGAQIHTVKGPGFFSQALDPGRRYSFRFARAGRYPYLCTLHPTQMRGVIVVR